MKVFTLINYVLCKKFIVQSTQPLNEFMISSTGVSNVETLSIGDLYFTILESKNFPLSLYNFEQILHVEEDGEVTINDKQFVLLNNVKDFVPQKAYYLQENPVWGLDRVDQKSNLLNTKYYYPTTSGQNVDVYVIDTGIDIKHPEFENRAIWGDNFADNVNTDCNGHSTHVAGTIGSKTYGVAKKSTLISVKVLGCDGSGTYSGILKGFDFVLKRKKTSKNPSVINMSLGGGKSQAINNAVSELVKNNVVVVVAAGNENQDACNTSPASCESAITVGATSKTNEFAGFSNYGKCVNILAPGVDILSTVPNNKTTFLSGTSMATPHTAGGTLGDILRATGVIPDY